MSASSLRAWALLVSSFAALASCSSTQNGHAYGDVITLPDGAVVTVWPDGAVTNGNGNIPANCPVGNEQIQQYILVPQCGSCHGSSNPQGSLDLASPDLAMRLTNAPSATCSGERLLVPGDPNASFLYRKVADTRPRCGARMPLTGALPADQIACLEAWIRDGARPTPADAATPDVDASSTWVPTPGTTPDCVAIEGVNTTPEMCPGSDCISCHSAGGQASDWEVRWTVAGTVFHSPTDDVSNGVAGARVHITDANGVVVNLTTNSVGNFYTRAAVTYPLMAEVTNGTSTVAMPIPVPNGSCNNCHTLPSANLAAGRIYVGM